MTIAVDLGCKATKQTNLYNKVIYVTITCINKVTFVTISCINKVTYVTITIACPGKSVVRWTDCPTMTIAVDLGRKATKQTNLYNKVTFVTISCINCV